MTFEKVLQAMKDGKKVTRQSLPPYFYYYVKDGKIYQHNSYDETEFWCEYIGTEIMFLDDWCLLEEYKNACKWKIEEFETTVIE